MEKLIKLMIDELQTELGLYEGENNILDDDTPDFEAEDEYARELVVQIEILEEALQRYKKNGPRN